MLGPVGGATVTLTKLDANGNSGRIVAIATTNADGTWTASVPAGASLVKASISGGAYADEATGEVKNLAAGEHYDTLLQDVSAGQTVAITPLTHIATQAAFANSQNGTSFKEAVDLSYRAVTQAAGLPSSDDIRFVKPANLGSLGAASEAEAKYTLVLAGLSQQAKDKSWSQNELVSAYVTLFVPNSGTGKVTDGDWTQGLSDAIDTWVVKQNAARTVENKVPALGTPTVVASLPFLSYASSLGTRANIGASIQITPSTLSNNGGMITGCRIQEGTTDFPSFLQLNRNTCVVTGTGSSPMPATMFHVIASNSAGDSLPANLVIEIRDKQRIASGDASTCGLSREGRAYCWGRSAYGSLGNFFANGSVQSPHEVVDTDSIGALSGLKALSMGCGLQPNGTVLCWGMGPNPSALPKAIAGLENKEIVDLDSGPTLTCALSVRGEILCWRNTALVPFSIDGTGKDSLRIVSLSVGYGAVLGITSHGSLYRWDISDSQLTRVSGENGSEFLRDITSFSAGQASHSCAVAKGNVLCWGRNNFGQLGNKSNVQSNKPVKTVDASGNTDMEGVVQVNAGFNHTCALTRDGSTYCWGQGNSGQIGTYNGNASKPVWIKSVSAVSTSPVISISAGSHHTCALREDGTVSCWGENSSGQIGIGTSTRSVTSASQVLGLKKTGFLQLTIDCSSRGAMACTPDTTYMGPAESGGSSNTVSNSYVGVGQ
jgi:alpha-tubulin suppressor-like RCC1 family protein